MKNWLFVAASFLLVSILDFPAFGAEPAEQSALIQLTAVDYESHADIFAQNYSYGEITVYLEAVLVNLNPSPALPVTITVPPQTRKKLVRLHVQKNSNAWSYRYNYTSAYGSLDTVHDDGYLYRLPYEPGKEYRLLQSFGGRFSHYEESLYAVDFSMPEGSLVLAAREGVVVATRNDSSRGGPDKSFRDDGNFVYVRHPDKSLGIYTHFKKGGVLVEAGDFVRPGDFIGLSGNTGWSSEPHLHFGIYKLLGGDMGQSVPFLFDTRKGIVNLPKKGEVYLVNQ